MKTRKVVIMTVPFGGGHHATAQTLADIFSSTETPVEVEIIDVITEAWPAFSRRSTDAYMRSTASPGGFWFRTYYHLSDRYPQPLRWFAGMAFAHHARKRMAELQPDLVIATFPFLAHVAMRARDGLGLQCPVVTVVTDAGEVQGIWLTGQEEHILVATEDTVEYAHSRKVSAERVKHLGFPVAARFAHPKPQAEARRILGLKDEFTVLVTAGGLGMNPRRVTAFARHLATLRQPMQLVLVAGKNAALRRTLESLDFPDSMDVTIYGYSTVMDEMMAAADIVCSKAGWLTISESLAVGRPLLLFDAIPGHEEENAKYVIRNSYGVFEKDPRKAAAFISRSASDPRQLDVYRTAIAAHPPQQEVRQRIAEYYLGLLQ